MVDSVSLKSGHANSAVKAGTAWIIITVRLTPICAIARKYSQSPMPKPTKPESVSQPTFVSGTAPLRKTIDKTPSSEPAITFLNHATCTGEILLKASA